MTRLTSMSRVTTCQNSLGKPDESTRLLPDAERGGTTRDAGFQVGAATPLPKVQLGTLIAMRIVNPIAYTQIFPYINQLLADLHIATPERVGFYSGFIESTYPLAQMFSVYQLGILSDVVGRRPVLIFGLIGTAISTVAFGWSTSLVTITASRFLGGLMAGNMAVHHSVLVEITDDTNQDIAVPIYSLAWSTGCIVGPLIGGTFANAATRYPGYFSWPVFVDHPYLFPCVVTAACALLGAGLGYLLIEETLPSKRKRAAKGVRGSASRSISCSAETEPASAKVLLAIPAIRALTLSGLALSFLNSAFDVVFTLFCYTPVDAGGLGLQPSTIGNFLAFAGTIAVLLQLVAMPYILRRFDYAATYDACMYLWPVTFALFPPLNAIARVTSAMHAPPTLTATPPTTTSPPVLWIMLAFALALSKVAAIPYSITMLLVKRHAPVSAKGSGSRTALGRSNGLVQFSMCIGRAIGPIVVSTLFTALNGSTWARRWGMSWTWSIFMVCFAVAGARVTKGIR